MARMSNPSSGNINKEEQAYRQRLMDSVNPSNLTPPDGGKGWETLYDIMEEVPYREVMSEDPLMQNDYDRGLEQIYEDRTAEYKNIDWLNMGRWKDALLETLGVPAIGEPTQAFDAANGTKNTGMNPGMSKKGIEEAGMATPDMPFLGTAPIDNTFLEREAGLSQKDLLGLVMGAMGSGVGSAKGIINATKGMRRRGTQDQTFGELITGKHRRLSKFEKENADDFFTRNIKKLFDSMEGKEF